MSSTRQPLARKVLVIPVHVLVFLGQKNLLLKIVQGERNAHSSRGGENPAFQLSFTYMAIIPYANYLEELELIPLG
ncbi:hypothetical protein CDAR_14441 [Caerostris darwini]|uniref:Uncharacterized protein n=1 Tax=Caerostris darwini TaxID=1538125 RepID=A0AAV4QFK2_9ARAC|nr:hypothetical protein CDAR_14441 [Caerostris darwini]